MPYYFSLLIPFVLSLPFMRISSVSRDDKDAVRLLWRLQGLPPPLEKYLLLNVFS